MTHIKQTGLPLSGTSWSMGERYMRRVSKLSASKLCAPAAVPRMGYETDAIVRPDGYGGWHRLTVQNISGHFYVACCSLQVDSWPDVFSVTVEA